MSTLNTVQPYHYVLDNGLTLKSIKNDADAERLIAFNGHVFGTGEAAMTRSLIFHHPASRPDYWLYIEDETQIVSSLVLIPWEWRYEDVTLKSGEMGIVGTLESYRNRGLIRALNVRFTQLLRAGNFHLSHIQGIPYFYRQFGYEYALPLEAQWRVELDQLSMHTDPAIRFRLATSDDIPTLQCFYDTAARQLDISAVRTAETWRYLLEHTTGTATEAETWLLESGQQPLAYCRLSRHGFSEGLIVSEASRLDASTARTLLHWLKSTAIQRSKPFIRFNLPAASDLLHVAREYGAHDTGGYQWQIRVVDAAALLRQLTPVLERRLTNSSLAGLSEKVVINLYRTSVELDLVDGQLRSVNSTPGWNQSQINIPPNLFASLVLGYHTREDLEALASFYPDLGIHGQSKDLIDTLFPKMQAFINTLY